MLVHLTHFKGKISLVLKYCSSRIRTKFRYTSNTSKLKLSVISIAQNSLNSTRNPGSLAGPHSPHAANLPACSWLKEPRAESLTADRQVTVWESFCEIKCNYVECGSVLCTAVYRSVHSCTHLQYVYTTVDLRSIVPTAVGTSHLHCTKCPQLWSDKFRPWSISAGGTPQSVLLYDGCYWMCTQTEFSDLL